MPRFLSSIFNIIPTTKFFHVSEATIMKIVFFWIYVNDAFFRTTSKNFLSVIYHLPTSHPFRSERVNFIRNGLPMISKEYPNSVTELSSRISNKISSLNDAQESPWHSAIRHKHL